MSTIWKEIDGYPDYEISMDGRLRSWRRKARKWRNPQEQRRDSPVEVTGTISRPGYLIFSLRAYPGAKIKRFLAHRLVAIAFLPNPLNLSDVAHEDGTKLNNHASNLRWSTHYDNQMDMRRHGTMQDGEKSCTCKLTPEQVHDIREFAATYGRGSGVILAKKYGISKAQVSRILNGSRWKSTIA